MEKLSDQKPEKLPLKKNARFDVFSFLKEEYSVYQKTKKENLTKEQELSDFINYIQKKHPDLDQKIKEKLKNLTVKDLSKLKIEIWLKPWWLTDIEKQLFKNSKTEEQVINTSLELLSSKVSEIPWFKPNYWNEFLQKNKIEKDSNWKPIIKIWSSIQTISDLKDIFYRFLETKGIKVSDLKKNNEDIFNTLEDIFENYDRDPSGKVLTSTLVKKFEENLKKQNVNKEVLKKFKSNPIFSQRLQNKIPWYSRPTVKDLSRTWETEFERMYNKLLNFLKENIGEDKKISDLAKISFNFQDLYNNWINLWLFKKNDENLLQKITEVDKKFQRMINKLSPLVISKELIDYNQELEPKLENIKWLFQSKIKTLWDLLSKFTDKLPWNEIDVFGPAYKELKDEYQRILNYIEETENLLAITTDEIKIKKLEEKLANLKEKKIELENTIAKWSENEKIWLEYLENFKYNTKLYNILKKLYENNFDFEKLTEDETNILSLQLLEEHLKELENNNLLNFFESENYKKFLLDIFDVTKTETFFQTAQWKSYKVVFSKNTEWKTEKWFLNKTLSKLIDIKDFIKYNKLPYYIKIDLDKSDEWLEETLYNYFKVINWAGSSLWKINGKIYSESYLIELDNKNWKKLQWYFSSVPPIWYNDDSEDKIYLYDYPVNQPTKNWKIRRLLWVYTLDELKKIDINILKKDLLIQGNQINDFKNAYILANTFNSDELWEEIQNKIQNDNKELQNFIDNWDIKINPAISEDNINENNQENIENSTNNPLEEVNWYLKNNELKVWDYFIVGAWETQKTPWGWMAYYKWKVNKINNENIILTAEWVHWGVNKQQKLRIPNDPKSLWKFIDFFKSRWILKFSSPSWNFNKHIDLLKKEGKFDDSFKKTLSLFDKIERNWRSFVDKKDKKKEMCFYIKDTRWLTKTQTYQTVKVDIKPTINNKFKVSLTYLDKYKDKKWKNKDKLQKMEYKFETDYNWLLVFINSKWDNISLESKEIVEQKIEEEKINLEEKWAYPKQWVNWIWFKHIIPSIKKRFSWIKDYLNSTDEAKTYAFEDAILWSPNSIFAKLSWLPIIGWAFNEMQLKHLNDKDNMIYKKIQYYMDLEFTTSMHHSYIISQRIIPLLSKYIDINTWKIKKYPNYNDRLRLIAAMMYMLQKEKNLYSRALAPLAWKWVWVNLIFGPKVYQRFVSERERKISEKNNDKNLQTLATLEVDVIIDNLRWWEHFVEQWPPNLFYNRLFSRKLAKEIAWLKWWLKDTSSREWEYKAKIFASYDFCVSELEWNLRKNKIPEAMWILMAMYEMAQTKEQYEWVKKYALMLMLTKSYYYETDVWLKLAFDKKFRWMKFPILWFHFDWDQDKKVASILDIISWWKFSKIFSNDLLSKISWYSTRWEYMWEFIKKFNSFWNSNSSEILNKLSLKDISSKDNLIALAKNPEIKEYKWRKLTDNDKNLLNELIAFYQDPPIKKIEWAWKLPEYWVVYEDAFYTASFDLCKSLWVKPDDEDWQKRYNPYWVSIGNTTEELKNTKLSSDQKNEFDFIMTRFIFVFARQISDSILPKLFATIAKVQQMKKEGKFENAQIEWNRIIASYLRWQIYEALWQERLPTEIQKPLQNMTDFLCNNLNLFDEKTADLLWWIHEISDASYFYKTWPEKFEYIPARERESLSYKEKEKLIKQYTSAWKELINWTIREWTIKFTWNEIDEKRYFRRSQKILNEEVDHITNQWREYLKRIWKLKNNSNNSKWTKTSKQISMPPPDKVKAIIQTLEEDNSKDINNK